MLSYNNDKILVVISTQGVMVWKGGSTCQLTINNSHAAEVLRWKKESVLDLYKWNIQLKLK